MAAKPSSFRPDKNRERMAHVADELTIALGDVDRGYVYLSQSSAELLKSAFDAFLSGQEKSLDAAFGIKRRRGAPKRGPETDATMELVEKALWRGRKSWNDVATETDRDTRYLQRLVERHGEEAVVKVAREVARRLDVKDEKRNGRQNE